MKEQTKDVKKTYKLIIQQDLFDEIEKVSKKWDTSVVEVMKRFFRLGLLAVELQEDKNGALIFRDSGVDKEILLF